MTETLRPWHPIARTDVELHLETVTRRVPEFDVEATLSRGKSADHALVLNFGYAVAYRVSPDYVYMRRPWWGTLEGKGSLFQVENSTYREWLEAESLGVYNQPFAHYCVISVDGCLDVLTLNALWQRGMTYSKRMQRVRHG